jgi:hypothetical protein
MSHLQQFIKNGRKVPVLKTLILVAVHFNNLRMTKEIAAQEPKTPPKTFNRRWGR